MDISKIKRDLTDREVFQSIQMRDYILYKLHVLHKQWNIPDAGMYLYYDESDSITAYTDNRSYVINAGNRMFDGTRSERLSYLCGASFHEAGHRIFTNFTASKTHFSWMTTGKFYPRNPRVKRLLQGNYDDLCACMVDANMVKKLMPIVSKMQNILEDGRIEFLLLSYCSSSKTLCDGLKSLRASIFEKMPAYEDLCDSITDEKLFFFEAFLQILLHYVRFGQIKGYSPDNSGDPLIALFDKVQKYADICVEAPDAGRFYAALNQILIQCWPEIKEYMDLVEPEDDESNEDNETGEGSGETIGKTIENRLENNIQGTTASSSEINGNCNEKSIKSAITAMQDKKGSSSPSTGPQYTRTTSIKGGSGGEISYINNWIEESNTKIDLNKLLNSIAEEHLDIQLEKQMAEDLNALCTGTDFGEIHRSVSCKIIRHDVTPANISDYEEIAPELIRIAKNIAKKTDYYSDEGYMQLKNRYYGKRFDSSTIARNDFRNFSKTVRFEDAPSIAVGVCIDESGSMSWDNREMAAKAMAITLYEYCHLMNIPISIIGHTTGRSSDVQIFNYCNFEKPDFKDRYRLMNISSRSSNRDGYAIRFLKAQLEALDVQSKLLVVVSDGRPAANGYSGTAANEDLRDIVKSCEAKNIGFIAAAIGSDKAQMRAIYGEKHFLDISNLSMLPVTLTKKIKTLLK